MNDSQSQVSLSDFPQQPWSVTIEASIFNASNPSKLSQLSTWIPDHSHARTVTHTYALWGLRINQSLFISGPNVGWWGKRQTRRGRNCPVFTSTWPQCKYHTILHNVFKDNLKPMNHLHTWLNWFDLDLLNLFKSFKLYFPLCSFYPSEENSAFNIV